MTTTEICTSQYARTSQRICATPSTTPTRQQQQLRPNQAQPSLSFISVNKALGAPQSPFHRVSVNGIQTTDTEQANLAPQLIGNSPKRVNGACMDTNEVRFVQIAPSILDLGARQSTAYEATNYRVRWLHVRWLLSTPV